MANSSPLHISREAMDKAINHSLNDRDLEFSHGLAPSLVPDHPPYPPINKPPNPKHYTPKNPSPTPSTYETLKDSKNQNVTPTNQMYIRKNRPTYPVNTAPPKKPLHLQGGASVNPKKTGYITIAALNVKGANSPAMHNKWKTIICTMLTKRIAFLSVLESHSNNHQINYLNAHFGPSLHFTHMVNREHPWSGGIVIVTNLNKIHKTPSNITEIIPGRAAMW